MSARLGSAKAVLKVLRDRGIRVSRVTLHRWRTALPRKLRPPLETTLHGIHVRVTCDRQALDAWIGSMEARNFFQRSSKWHATHERKKAAAQAAS